MTAIVVMTHLGSLITKERYIFLLGDIITGSKRRGSSVRLGGFQVQRNYSTRPDLITYPLPQFIGQAARCQVQST